MRPLAVAAATIYVRAHKQTTVLAVASVLTSDEPYSTLNDLKESVKSHAVGVCG
jgi:hypothetical protein